MQRIGVFICHCGTNIAGTVDVKAVAEALSHEPGVVFSTDYQYMCSESGQQLMREAIREPLSEIISMVKMTLEETPPELAADIFDFGIVLVGGGALLPGIDQAISDRTGIRVVIAKRPLEAVCMGLGKMLQSAGDFSEFVKYKVK